MLYRATKALFCGETVMKVKKNVKQTPCKVQLVHEKQE